MFQEAPGLEQRLAELQAQIDRLTIALQLWRDGQERVAPADGRLSGFTDDTSALLEQWRDLSARHQRAVETLEHQAATLAQTERRLRQSDPYLRTLDRIVQEELAMLARRRPGPDGTRSAAAAAGPRAEVPAPDAAALPPALVRRPEVERELQWLFSTAFTGGRDAARPRPSRQPASRAVVQPPMQVRVQALHTRRAGSPGPASGALPTVPPPPAAVPSGVVPGGPVAPSAPPPRSATSAPARPASPAAPRAPQATAASRGTATTAARTPAAPSAPAAPPAPTDAGARRLRELECRMDVASSTAASDTALLRADVHSRFTALQLRLDEAEQTAARSRQEERRMTTRLTVIIALLVIILAGGMWWTVQLQQRMLSTEQRLSTVERDAARALEEASGQLAALRADLARKDGEARQAAERAATMSGVLAAPDVVRYALTALDGSGASAQVLWSRSRGLVFSATGLAALPAGSAYQLWLTGPDGAVSAGLLALDDQGRATLVHDGRAERPRPLASIVVTVEPAAGGAEPSARTVAAWRAPRPTP